VNNHFEPLDNGEVLSINESELIYIGHTTFRVGEFAEAVRTKLEATEGWNEQKNAWFTDTGVDCEVLRFTSGGWVKGKVRLRLEFSPEDGGASSDTKSVSVQPSTPTVAATPQPISTPDGVSGTTALTDTPQTEDTSSGFPVAAALGVAAIGTAVLSGMDLAHGDSSSESSLEDLEADSSVSSVEEDFNLAPPTPEVELASLEEFDPFAAELSSSEDSSLEEMDFDLDTPDSALEVTNLESGDPLAALEVDDFSLEASSTDLSDLDEEDFGLDSPVDMEGTVSLEEADFGLDSPDADLSGLGEEDFSLASLDEESPDLENPLLEDQVSQEVNSLDNGDFSLETPPDMGLESLSDVDLSSLGAEDFDLETSDQELSGLENGDFGLESSTSEQELGIIGDEDFDFGSSPEQEAPEMEDQDFGLEEFGEDFAGLENADFDGEAAPATVTVSLLEDAEVDFLGDGLETPELSLETSDFLLEDVGGEDFGLDDLLADDFGGDDLESLSISDQDKQEFEQASAAVSQAFDEDFGLELESATIANGVDNLDFSFAEDDEIDAIDRQLAEAMEDDLGLLGVSEGLTENIFGDQDDSLFKDVWEDMSRKVK